MSKKVKGRLYITTQNGWTMIYKANEKQVRRIDKERVFSLDELTLLKCSYGTLVMDIFEDNSVSSPR